ncbi:ankyrin repeat-containing domain protein [Panaeolus papilionaceus]|nr:ankyrin repeat-containing domain protein [Panaeolus papilionaceus]
MARTLSNLWVAAGDGDLQRVKHLIENESLSPNLPDEFTYTPMHAAASYGHIHVLEYLISHGGDVNVTDEDGDTPLYSVENLQTARYLVEHGAAVDRQNLEGISPIDHLTEDFPQIADYLRSTLPSNLTNSSSSVPTTPTSASDPSASLAVHLPSAQPTLSNLTSPSQHSQNAASELLTSALMSQVDEILQRAEAEGRDPEEELRQVVGRAVIDGVVTGFGMVDQSSQSDDRREQPDDSTAKRQRMDEP